MQGRDGARSVWPRTLAVFAVVCGVTTGLVLVARPAPLNRPIGDDVDDLVRPTGGRVSTRWKSIVIHDSRTPAGSAEAFDTYYRDVLDQPEGMGWHFLVRRGSTGGRKLIDVGGRWLRQEDGCHTFNRHDQEAIGVCVVGHFRRQRPTGEQMKCLTWLVRSLQRACRIPARNVRLHRELVPASDCPGRQFPDEEFRRSLVADADLNG